LKEKNLPPLLLLVLISFLFPALAFAMDVNLAWDPNSGDNLAGYHVYAREEGEAYNYNHPEWEGTDTQCTVKGFDEYESYYFVVRAFDSDGNESGDSNEVYLASEYAPDSSLDNGGSASGGGGGGGGCFIVSLIGD
jgi:hypothetical protein